MTDERKELGRKVRRKVHDSVPTCICAVDHGEYVGAYFYPEDVPEAEKAIAALTWELTVVARAVPAIANSHSIKM